jgi:hypothetical protein
MKPTRMATICSAPGARQVGGDRVKVTGILGPDTLA